MTVSLWRISPDTPAYSSDDLSGIGAKTTGGRWNRKNNAVVYASISIALACLETVVHLPSGLPLNRYLVRIDVPDPVWASAQAFNAAVPSSVGWDAAPVGVVSLDEGDKWLASLGSALLLVPSVIIAEELNVLINPAHPDSKLIKATKIRRFAYDPRLHS